MIYEYACCHSSIEALVQKKMKTDGNCQSLKQTVGKDLML